MFSAKTESVLFSCFLWVWRRNPRSNIRFAERLIQGVWKLWPTHRVERQWQRERDNFALFSCSSYFKVSDNTVNMNQRIRNTNFYKKLSQPWAREVWLMEKLFGQFEHVSSYIFFVFCQNRIHFWLKPFEVSSEKQNKVRQCGFQLYMIRTNIELSIIAYHGLHG